MQNKSSNAASTQNQIHAAKEVVAYYTLAAAGTGAVPVPAASVAVVAENGVMITHIASKLGQEIDLSTVISSISIAGTLNVVGKSLFIEGARLLSWGTGSIWALAALSAFGASTAGVQTYMTGMLAIEIGKNNGHRLPPEISGNIIKEAKRTYDSFKREWEKTPPARPSCLVN